MKNALRLSPLILGFLFLVPFASLVALGMLNSFGFADEWNEYIRNAIGGNVNFETIFLTLAPALSAGIGVLYFLYARNMPIGPARAIGMYGSILLVCAGLGFLVILFGHDAIPCFLNGLFRDGPAQLPQLIELCRNA